jgi:Zn-dependent protease
MFLPLPSNMERHASESIAFPADTVPWIDIAPVGPPHPLPFPTRRLWLHTLLLLLTLVTTTVMGARFMDNFRHGMPALSADRDMFPYLDVLRHPQDLCSGLPFSLTLLAILLSHEMGHFLYARRHRVNASLPFVLPAPTLSGTAGAVIRLRSRIPNRAALMDIGISGPIAGFVVALPLTFMGLLLSREDSIAAAGTLIHFQSPLAMHALHLMATRVHPQTPALDVMLPHPVLLASWVGLFITCLNLIPAGQLDGGHVLYASAPRAHRSVTFIVIGLLVLAGIFLWIGWLLWAAILLLPAMRHPRVSIHPDLPPGRRWLAPVAIAIFLLCAEPSPFVSVRLIDFLR